MNSFNAVAVSLSEYKQVISSEISSSAARLTLCSHRLKHHLQILWSDRFNHILHLM